MIFFCHEALWGYKSLLLKYGSTNLLKVRVNLIYHNNFNFESNTSLIEPYRTDNVKSINLDMKGEKKNLIKGYYIKIIYKTFLPYIIFQVMGAFDEFMNFRNDIVEPVCQSQT